MICSGHTKTPVQKDRRFVWKAKDFFLIEVYFCWLGRVVRVVLLSLFFLFCKFARKF